METTERNRLRRDIGWNLVPVALLAVVGLSLNFGIGRWWGAPALGAFNLVTIAFFAFAIIGSCGLQFAVLRAIAEDPEDRERVAVIAVGGLIPVVAIAAGTTGIFIALREPFAVWLHSPAIADGVMWAAPGLFCFAVNKVLLAIVNGQRRMRAFAIYTSLRYWLLGMGLVLARIVELDADQLPVIWTFAEGTLLVVLCCEVVATVALRRGLAADWRAWTRRHLDFGTRGVTAALASEINSKLDVWMLGIALSDHAVGIYSLASAIYEGAMQLGVVVQNNVNPVFVRSLALGKPDDVERVVRQTRRWFVPALAGAAAIGALAYPHLIPWLVDNAEFRDGALPFALLMLGMALASPILPFNQLLVMAALPGWHTFYMLATLAVSFVGNLVLIPSYGLEGAATATAISLVVSALLLRVMVRWRTAVRI